MNLSGFYLAFFEWITDWLKALQALFCTPILTRTNKWKTMPRQTFLSRESFVDATEKQTKETLFAIPAYVSHIQFLAENKLIESFKFSYEQAEKKRQYVIDVSILPLNDQYTRISLHASRSNGNAFYEDSDMAFALHDFESAIHAALKGDLAQYQPRGQKQKETNGLSQFFSGFKSSLGGLIFRKKLSW